MQNRAYGKGHVRFDGTTFVCIIGRFDKIMDGPRTFQELFIKCFNSMQPAFIIL